MKQNKLLVIDGQGGRMGAALVSQCKAAGHAAEIIAVGATTAAPAGAAATCSARRASAGIAAASSARRASAGIATGASSLAPGAAGCTVATIARGAMVVPRVSPVFGRRALVGLFVLVLIVG